MGYRNLCTVTMKYQFNFSLENMWDLEKQLRNSLSGNLLASLIYFWVDSSSTSWLWYILSSLGMIRAIFCVSDSSQGKAVQDSTSACQERRFNNWWIPCLDQGLCWLTCICWCFFINQRSCWSHSWWFTQWLWIQFYLKDLKEVHYFLGIQVSHTNDGLHLSQTNYI